MSWIILPLDPLFELPKWYFVAILGVGFFTYYLLGVVKGGTKLKDGGQVALDWLEDGCPANAPIIIILPGLTGHSQSQYIRCLVLAANCIKLRAVVFNYRGLGGISLKTPRTYNAANFEDLSEVVRHVKSLNPGVPLAAAGVSLGGLILGNYLASRRAASGKMLVAAMVISTPWNCFKAMDSLEKPVLNLMLNRYLTSKFFRFIDRVKHDSMLLQGPWSMEDILKCKTVREFDSSYTAKQFGYKDVNHYYADASIHNKLHKIKVPMLCLSARDDPFQPYEAIPVEEASKSKYVAIVITQYGGHIGFLEGIFPVLHEEYICRLFMGYFSGVFSSGSKLLASISKGH